MRYPKTIIITILFFLIINTNYFWEGELGAFAIPIFLFLLAVYLGLIIVLLRHLYFAFEEKFKEKYRLYLIILLTFVLTLTFIRPLGFIDFENLTETNLLVASIEGAANCVTTIKLKDNNTFSERNVCFGTLKIKGTYKFLNDTIFFENVEFHRSPYEYYKFAVIRPSKFKSGDTHFDLVRYFDLKDTTGQTLLIIQNDLNTFKNKTPNR